MAASTLFQLPFNGTAEGTGSNPVTAQVTDGLYVSGRTSNQALSFPDEGKAEVLEQAVPLNDTYTMSFWIKAKQQPDGPESSWMLFKFGGSDRYLYLDLNSTLTSWSYLVIVQDTDRVSAYVNDQLAGTERMPDDWGKPVGFCVVNDASGPSGNMTLQDVTLYDGVVDNLPPIDPILLPDMEVNYFINGVNFRTNGVYVSASDGLLENLTMKDPLSFEWPDYHGQIIDLSRPLYQSRVLTLSCFIKAADPTEFIEQLNLFLTQFQRSYTQRLKLTVFEKPLVYEVYLRDSINLKKKWSASGMVGTFELQLIEPNPLKRVLSCDEATASITLSTSKVVSIHWGDKTHTFDVYGQNVTVTHTYSTPGPHEIIVAGVLEDITEFTSNCPVLWSKL